MSYSQHPGEEAAILKIFGEGLPGTFRGKALEIGAWIGTTFSNTRALYERGWYLVLVEPAPGPMVQLLRTCSKCGSSPGERYGERKQARCDSCKDRAETRYGYDPRVTLIQAAVARERSLLRMWATDDALSTGCDDQTQRWGDQGGYYGRVWVPTITVNDIVNQFGPFDFISIDAEGMNQEVFFGVPLAAMRPKSLIVEYSSAGERATMSNHAHKHGYVEYFATGESGGNVIYVSQEWMRAIPK